MMALQLTLAGHGRCLRRYSRRKRLGASSLKRTSGGVNADVVSVMLITLGGIVTLIAFFWWLSFYSEVSRQMRGRADLSDALSCLFSSGGVCGFVQSLAQMSGKTPYTPVIFWIGVGAFALGVITKVASPASANQADQPADQVNRSSKDVAAALESMMKKCPQCAERVKLEALVCRYCNHSFGVENVQRQIETAKLELARTVVPQAVDEWMTCPHCGRVVRPDPETRECYLCHRNVSQPAVRQA